MQDLSNTNYKETLFRLFSYFIPFKKGVVAGVLALIVFSIVDAGMVKYVQPLIDDGLNKNNGYVLKMGALLVLVIFLVRGIASFISNYCAAWVSNHVIKRIRQDVFGHMLKLPVSYYDRHNTGQLLSKLTYDTEQIALATSDAMITMLRESVLIIVYLAVMINASWQLSAIFLITVPVIGLLLSLVSRRFRKVSAKMQESMGLITKNLEQSLTGHKNILACTTQEQETQIFAEVNNHNRQQRMKLATISAISNPIIQLIGSSAIAIVLFVASLDGMINTLTSGAFLTVVVAMGSILKPVKQISKVNELMQRGLTAAASVFQVLDEEPEQDTGTRKVDSCKGELLLKDLTFNYPNHEKQVLNKVNLQINSGETVAFVGESGSGKSTIISLLLRFYDTQGPQIYLDGHAVSDYELRELRNQFSLVSQQITLLNDSIRANIAYGCHREVTPEEIEAAAEAAQVLAFSKELPEGLDTEIGENGGKLSGGQRQRIAIARAFLRNSPIILLDEATSALDNTSEAKVQEALNELLKGKTCIVVAHRLSTIENADKIVVMSQGRILEVGNHSELMDSKGMYCQLYNQHNQIQE